MRKDLSTHATSHDTNNLFTNLIERKSIRKENDEEMNMLFQCLPIKLFDKAWLIFHKQFAQWKQVGSLPIDLTSNQTFAAAFDLFMNFPMSKSVEYA